jgi:hypothetical protein
VSERDPANPFGEPRRRSGLRARMAFRLGQLWESVTRMLDALWWLPPY